MADDPDFSTLRATYGGEVVTPETVDKSDPLYDIPKEWEDLFVLLERGTPLNVQAPGAAGRRIGGEPFEPTGPTVTGGGGKRITLADLVRDYYRADTKTLAQYQQMLWLGGFYTGKTVPAFGIADERGEAAFRKAALRAARSKKTFSEILREAAEAGAGADGNAQAKRAPLSIQVTSPQDIARMARAAAVEMLGSNDVDPEQIQRIVNRYQAVESSAQENAYNANYDGGTTVRAPELQTFVTEELRQDDPVGTTAYTAADSTMANFFGAISGPFGG